MDPTNVPAAEAARQQNEHPDPTGILARLAHADALVRRVGAARIGAVSLFGSTSDLHPTDYKDGHAIAAELGLTTMVALSGAVHYSGVVGGRKCGVFASLVEVFEHVVFLDSNPAGEPGGESFEQYLTREAAAEAARGSYGQVRWEPSGADEYTFTDDNGRRGYVVVRPYVAVA